MGRPVVVTRSNLAHGGNTRRLAHSMPPLVITISRAILSDSSTERLGSWAVQGKMQWN